MRKSLDLTRSELAALTRIGEASLGRWERGAQLQNAACDEYLRLLQDSGNLRRLLARRDCHAVAAEPG